MNDKQSSSNIYSPNLRLTESEQALLRTALSSNSPRTLIAPSFSQKSASGNAGAQMASGTPTQRSRDTMTNNSNIHTSPDQEGPASGLDADTSPLLDFDLEDGNFDRDLNGDLFDDLPGLPSGDSSEHHDKRKKYREENDDEEEGSGKRRESDEKTGRKPGRKPLTGEPTTVSL